MGDIKIKKGGEKFTAVDADLTPVPTIFLDSPEPIPPPLMHGWSDRFSPIEQHASQVYLSGSAKGWPIPYIYGTVKVSGQVIACDLDGDDLYIVYLLSEGELSSISSVKLNDIAIASFSGYVDHDTYVGAASQTIDSDLNSAIASWSDTHDNGLKAVTGRSTGRAYAWVRIDTTQASVPGVPTLTCEVTRGNVDDWSSTSRASTNPVVALWDYMSTHTGLTSSDIDTTSWDAVRTWCDTDPGDGSDLWSLNIALTGSSDNDCVQQILKHFFGSMSWYDGKLYLTARRTLSSATLTIGTDEIIRPLKWSRVPLHQRPNYVDVLYTDSSSWQQQKKNSAASGINRNSANCRAIEVNLPGCTVASMAKRYAVQYRKLLTNETLLVDFSITSVGVELNPGDRVDVTTPTGLSDQQIRVDQITALPSGEFVIRGTSYDATAQDTSTDTADSVPSTSVPGTNILPTAPTAGNYIANQLTITDQFGEDDVRQWKSISWTAGAGGDEVVAWEFECRDSTDTDPDSTIERSLDVLWRPGASSSKWSDDVPADFSSSTPFTLATHDQARVVAVGKHGGEATSAWMTVSVMAGSTNSLNGGFIDLTDTPAAYTGNGGKVLAVNSTPDAVEFVAASTLDTNAVSLQGDDIYSSISPSDGDVLTWDDSNSRWDAEAPSSGSAPQSAAATVTDTTATGLSDQTMAEETSGGPWIVAFVGNVDSTDDCYFDVTIDGSKIIENCLCDSDDVCVGVNGTYPTPLYARTSFKVEARIVTSGSCDTRTIYQQVSTS